ncbi:hypothetical protein PR048_016400 [Dryococelus australis]|uniref:Uncharacterized protein n=1 Tax=Dryococelus australis TaxID=614101 RepID=A0ABQ9HKS9_9NEOP|nr:hypothetical protein PR048_016400 [Dryococelus australis]
MAPSTCDTSVIGLNSPTSRETTAHVAVVVPELAERDCGNRATCCELILANVPAHDALVSSDEAHFHLNGTINMRYFRYWAKLANFTRNHCTCCCLVRHWQFRDGDLLTSIVHGRRPTESCDTQRNGPTLRLNSPSQCVMEHFRTRLNMRIRIAGH